MLMVLFLICSFFSCVLPTPLLYSGDGSLEDENIEQVLRAFFYQEQQKNKNQTSSNLSGAVNSSVTNLTANFLNQTEEVAYEDEENSFHLDYADYIQEEVQRVVMRRKYNDALPIPLQNLPHDVPPDRSVAEVLAENTIKDVQYDEQRIRNLVEELLRQTSLHDFGEIYSDDNLDENYLPQPFNPTNT